MRVGNLIVKLLLMSDGTPRNLEFMRLNFQSLHERRPVDALQDPIKWHIWQSVSEAIKNLLLYVFRGLRLIEIGKLNQMKIYRMEELMLNQFALRKFENDDEILEGLMQKVNLILGMDLAKPKFDQKQQAEELKSLILEQFKKFRERDKNSFRKEELETTRLNDTTRQHDSTKQTDTNLTFQQHVGFSKSYTSRLNEKSFAAELNEMTRQESKLQFKEQLQKPVGQFKSMTKNQINFLHKINKISVSGDGHYRNLRIMQLEEVIAQKIGVALRTAETISQKLSRLHGIEPSLTERKPIPQQTYNFPLESQRSSFTNPKLKRGTSSQMSLSNLINKKIFEKKIKVIVPKKDMKVEGARSSQLTLQKNPILQNTFTRKEMSVKLMQYVQFQRQQHQEQQLISNYLTTEKMAKIKLIQQYFKRYLKNKDLERRQSKTFHLQKKINSMHYLNVQMIKLKSKSHHQINVRDQKAPQCTTKILKMDASALKGFLERQKENKVDYKEKIRQSKQRKIFEAVRRNRVKIIEDSGFTFQLEDFNSKDGVQNTPLFYSAVANQFEMCHFLLKQGANPNMRCSHGQTPTHMAFQTQNQRLIELFYEFGADLNLRDDSGLTPEDMLKQAESPSKRKVKFAQTPTYEDGLEFRMETFGH